MILKSIGLLSITTAHYPLSLSTKYPFQIFGVEKKKTIAPAKDWQPDQHFIGYCKIYHGSLVHFR